MLGDPVENALKLKKVPEMKLKNFHFGCPPPEIKKEKRLSLPRPQKSKGFIQKSRL